MLIFLKRRYVDLVLAGTKTSTIRPWPRCRLRPGSPISFNGHLRAVCTSVERRRIADLLDADIHADGFATRADFERAFHTTYEHATPETAVWVIRFELASSQSARAAVTSDQG